jgi:integrase
VKRFKGKEHEPWPEALLEDALGDPQIGMAVALFYFTGQRINEVVKMGWRDVAGGFMEVYAQKQKRHIKVAIHPELGEMLERQAKPAVTILTNANGQPWTQSGLRQKLQDWAAERGHKIVPHGLRKNAVNALFEAGCTAAEVSGITDQSLAMLEHYSKKANKPAMGMAAVSKLDAHRKGKKANG